MILKKTIKKLIDQLIERLIIKMSDVRVVFETDWFKY